MVDNMKDSKVIPSDIIAYDDSDAYFVVAADKGTATFSDQANEIANESKFWLGDAFASGGSNGYDHKKLGITAKGAWESVKWHFKEMEKPLDKPYTVVGIGDMGGDVFGNGLLLARYAKLIAAFNHKHIFIDPDPDVDLSFKERTRLFTSKDSQWSDYSQSISEGGGFFQGQLNPYPLLHR